MRSFYLLIPAIVFFSCAKEKKDDSVIAIPNKTEKTMQAEEPFAIDSYANKALILSDKMDIYNTHKEVIGNEKGLYGLIVDLDGISKYRFDLTNSDDDCNLHNFVKVKSNKVSGWVYGKDVYEYMKERDTSFTKNGEYFKLSPIRNFDIGASDNDGLTFCSDYNPAMLYNSRYDKSELIPVKDKTGKYSCDYFVMEENDMCYDKIKEATLSDDILTLIIHRDYQEGAADFTIVIHLKKEGSAAEVTDVKNYE